MQKAAGSAGGTAGAAVSSAGARLQLVSRQPKQPPPVVEGRAGRQAGSKEGQAADGVRCWCPPAPALPSLRIEERLQSLSDTKAYNILHLRAEDDWIEHCVHWESIEDGECLGRQAASSSSSTEAPALLTTSAPSHVHAAAPVPGRSVSLPYQQQFVTACIA
jgi:hypothetical protein